MTGDDDRATHVVIPLADAIATLEAQRAPRSVALFGHGSLLTKFYAPLGTDAQTPHTRDEVYVVARGTAQFWDGMAHRPCGPGDMLFVAAGAPHRFDGFSEDFGVWVFFYGPEGGEVVSPS